MKQGIIISCVLGLLCTSFLYVNQSKKVDDSTPNYNSNWVDSLYNTLSNDERLGQLFMIRAHSDLGQEHINEVIRQIQTFHVGGLCFFQGTPEKQAELVNQYQALSSKIPLLVGIDAEWGLGMRMKSSTISFPRQLALGAIQDNRSIYEMGREIARQLKLTGINVNFAPVADINNNPDNPVINTRSFGEDRYNVTVKSYMYMKGMQDNQVLACAKHFPGHGDTDVDSHLDLPVIPHKRERLDSIELYPFRALVQHGVGSIMVAHLDVPELVEHANLPTTLSKNTIHQVLKEELGFEGIVLTDALEMKGVTKHFEPGRVEVEALKAGNDMLLLPVNIDASIREIKRSLETGELKWTQIETAVKKVLSTKYELGLTSFETLKLDSLRSKLNNPEAHSLKRKLIRESMTLVRNENQIVPFLGYDSIDIASIAIGTSNKNSFQRRIDSYTKATHFQTGKTISSAQHNQFVKDLSKHDVVIVSLHDMSSYSSQGFGISQSAIQLIDALNEKTKVILVVFGSPYSLRYFDQINNILVAYEENKDALDLAAQALFGAFAIKGRLPVTASEKSVFNQGVITKKSYRLGFGLPEESGLNSSKLAQIDEIAQEAVDSRATPGCVVLVAKDGKVVYQKAFGHHTYSKRRRVTETDIYDLASITKIAASTISLMKMVENNKISLDAPIVNYLPYLKGSNKEGLTLRDILAHVSGLKSWIPFYKETVVGSRRRKRPSKKFYQTFPGENHMVPVTEKLFMINGYTDTIWNQIRDSDLPNLGQYYYSDLGFYFVARIIENLTGRGIDSYTQEHFYHPLGLKNTSFRPWEKFDKNRLVPSEIDRYFRAQEIRGYVHDMGAAMLGGVSGHAGLFSNAEELAIIMQMLLQNGQYGGIQFLLPETIHEFTQRHPQSTRRGIGFDMKESNPLRETNMSPKASLHAFGHQGFTGTVTWVDPEHQLIYVFLSNRTYPSMNNYKLGKMDTRSRIQDVIYEALNEQKSNDYL